MTSAGRSALDTYLSEHGVGPEGVPLKWSKESTYVRNDTGEEVKVGTELVCIYTETQAGRIKFSGKGVPPERHMGPIFEGYLPPPRAELGDLDESLWDRDLSGKPADPWQEQMLLPLQDAENGEMFYFTTTSITGRKAVQNLLRQCERLAKKEPGYWPVVRLATGGFDHRDERVGFVKTPAFIVVGKTPKETGAKLAVAQDLDDEIGF